MPQYEVGSEEYWAAERAKEEENRQVLIAEQGEDVVNRNPRTWKLPASPQPGVTLAPGRRLTQTGDQMPGKEYALMSQQQGIERDLQKRIIATRMEGQGRVLGYTPEQEKQIDALEKAYTTVLSKPNEWTAEQTQEYALRVQQAKNSMIKSWVKRPPTPQEIYDNQAHVIDKKTGRSLLYDAKTGKFTPDEDILPAKLKVEILKQVMEENQIVDEEGNATPGDPAKIRAAYAAVVLPYYEVLGIETGQQPQGQPGQPPPQAGGGTIGRRPQVVQQPQETQLPTFDEITPEQQKEAIANFNAEESKRETRRNIGRYSLAGGGATTTKPMSEQEFKDRAKEDGAFLRNYIKARKPGALPESWDDTTAKERQTMYDNYYASRKAGDEVLGKSEFERKVRKDPSIIQEFLKSKGTKATAQAMVLPNEKQAAYNWAKANPNDPRSKKILEKLGKE